MLTAANHHSPRRPTFRTYRDVPTLPEKIRLLCEIIATTAPYSTAAALASSGVSVTQASVENVLNLSYPFPTSVMEFFRWAGSLPGHIHSPLSWNLLVDLLGKNLLFVEMWDVIGSMKRQRLVSLATFASVFSSYVIAGRVGDALAAFEVMHRYDVEVNVVALNSLVSSICRDGNSVDASEYVRAVKRLNVIRPDADTYAILLEGWEKEKDVVNARQTFAEMVMEIGWGNANTFAYEACLCTLMFGRDGLSEAMVVLGKMAKRGCHPGIRFFGLVSEECYKRGDLRAMESLWEALDWTKLRPDVGMYCKMVALYCYKGSIEQAKKVFDELVSNGGFPDSRTCNVLFLNLVNSKKLNEAVALLSDMVKRGWVPDQTSCGDAVRLSVESNNGYMACKIWQSMVAAYKTGLEETGNLLLLGLSEFGMVDEAAMYYEGMVKKGIKLTSSTLSKLKQVLPLSDEVIRMSVDSNGSSKAQDKKRELNQPVTEQTKRRFDVSKMKCFSCQQKGHLGKDCSFKGRVRDQANSNEAVRLSVNSNGPSKAEDRKRKLKLNLPMTKKIKKSTNVSKIKCFNCQQKGHFGKDCPSKADEMKGRVRDQESSDEAIRNVNEVKRPVRDQANHVEAIRLCVDSKGASKVGDSKRKLNLPVTKKTKRSMNILKMKCFNCQQKGHLGKDCPAR